MAQRGNNRTYGRSRRRRGGLFARLVPTFVLFGIVGTVLYGGGFWAADAPTRTQTDGPTDMIAPPPDDGTSGVIASSTEPPSDTGVTTGIIGQSFPNTPINVTDLSADNYLTRPSLTITTSPPRIETIRARRDETLSSIATQRGILVSALMYANGLNDPDRTLPVGITIKVPPKGTMLHRIRETDTLEAIARAYQVKPEQITGYVGNNIQQTGDLVAGSYLLIPTNNLPVRDRVVFYQVRPEDTLSKIGSIYGLLDARTLQWANNLQDVNFVQPGQVIAIPPTDGIIHIIDQDDTKRTTEDAVTQIAKNSACTTIPCETTPSDARVTKLRDGIFSFGPNGLTRGGKLVLGQEIIVPGGIPYIEPPPVVIPKNVVIDNPVSAPAPVLRPAPPLQPQPGGQPRPAPAPAPAPAPSIAAGFPGQFPAIYYPAQGVGSGRNPGFVWPETGTITSNFTSVHNGIDIATTIGTPLRAAASGYIVYAGWTSSGLGIAVYIDHGNGFVTVYGHMNDVAVKVGQYVTQGQYIGPEGSTGNSTGPHIHFMIIENNRSVNPFNYLP